MTIDTQPKGPEGSRKLLAILEPAIRAVEQYERHRKQDARRLSDLEESFYARIAEQVELSRSGMAGVIIRQLGAKIQPNEIIGHLYERMETAKAEVNTSIDQLIGTIEANEPEELSRIIHLIECWLGEKEGDVPQLPDELLGMATIEWNLFHLLEEARGGLRRKRRT